MATGTVATTARKFHHDLVHYVTTSVSYAAAGEKVIGKLPAGAVVIDAGVVVTTAFAGGTPQTADIGPSGDPDGLASAITLTTAGIIKADNLAANDDSLVSADTNYVVTISAGATPSAGAGYAYVAYIIANRGA